MAEFALPKNSRPTKGRHTPAPAGAKKVKTFRIYRYDPESEAKSFGVTAMPWPNAMLLSKCGRHGSGFIIPRASPGKSIPDLAPKPKSCKMR